MPIWLIIYLIVDIWIAISMASIWHAKADGSVCYEWNYYGWKKPFSQWKIDWTNYDLGILFVGLLLPFLLLPVAIKDNPKSFFWLFILPGRVIREMFKRILLFLSRTGRNLLFFFRPKSARTLADLIYFKNKEMKRWNSRLDKSRETLESSLRELKDYRDELEKVQANLKNNSSGLENDIERNERLLEAIRSRIDEFSAVIAKIGRETKRLERAKQTLDTRLHLHELYAKINPLVKYLDDTREPAMDCQANLAAAQETVRGLTAALNEAEMEVMVRIGMAPDKIAKDWLKAQGIEPVDDSAEKVIAEAKKVLA